MSNAYNTTARPAWGVSVAPTGAAAHGSGDRDHTPVVCRGIGRLIRRARPRLCAKPKRRFSAFQMTRCGHTRTTLHVQALQVAWRGRRDPVDSFHMVVPGRE